MSELLDRFNRLPAAWQDDRVLAAIQEHDRAAGRHEEVQTRLAASRARVETLGDPRLGDSLDELLGEVQTLAGLEQAAAFRPAPGVVRTDGATDAARDAMSAAMGALPEHRSHDVAAALEAAAYASWPAPMRADNPGPIVMPSEEALIAEVRAWRAERNSLQLAIQTWESPAIQDEGTLAALERAVSLIAQANRLRDDGITLAARVAHANDERERMGILWNPRAVHADSQLTQSPERKALERFRSERLAVTV